MSKLGASFKNPIIFISFTKDIITLRTSRLSGKCEPQHSKPKLVIKMLSDVKTPSKRLFYLLLVSEH